MEVIVYSGTPGSYVNILTPGLDTLEQAAAKFLQPFDIPFVYMDSEDIPPAPYITDAQTVTIDGNTATFGWDLPSAKQIATNYNAQYWQQQYEAGILGLSIDNSYQLALAVATPESERTADQVAAIEFMVGLNGLQSDVQSQIDAATSGEELITILNQLG